MKTTPFLPSFANAFLAVFFFIPLVRATFHFLTCNTFARTDRNCFKNAAYNLFPARMTIVFFGWRRKSFFGLQLCTRQSNYFHWGIVFVKDSDVQYLIGCGLSATEKGYEVMVHPLQTTVCASAVASFYLLFDAKSTNVLFEQEIRNSLNIQGVFIFRYSTIKFFNYRCIIHYSFIELIILSYYICFGFC